MLWNPFYLRCSPLPPALLRVPVLSAFFCGVCVCATTWYGTGIGTAAVVAVVSQMEGCGHSATPRPAAVGAIHSCKCNCTGNLIDVPVG